MKPVGVLLAAGNSSRFGSNKLSHPLKSGEVIGLRSARQLISVLDDCIAVVRQSDSQLCDELTQLGFKTVIQPHTDAGMGNSLSRAIRASKAAHSWLISLADMPWIKTETLLHVVTALQNCASIVAPVFKGQRGHPVGFNKKYRDDLLALDGDSGARSLLTTHSEHIQLLTVDDPGILSDVDTPEDLIQ